MEKIIGADISFWQDDPTTQRGVDFGQMSSGLDFVIIRAGQNLWSDKVFKTSWQKAKDAGIPRGSYWFYDSRADPKRQAEKYIETLGSDQGELPLVADFEDIYGGNYGSILDLYVFVENLKNLAPKKSVMIYTGYYYWREKLAELGKQKSKAEYFGKFPLWLAWYGIRQEEVIIPYPWSKWTLWQYTSSGDGSLYGVESREIDLNIYNGSKQDFLNEFNLSEKTDASTPPAQEIRSPKITVKIKP